jgi:signal transduction histidine kinase
MAHRREIDSPAPRSEITIRLAAAIALIAVPVFLPFDLHYGHSELRNVLLLYGANVALAIVALAATFTAAGRRFYFPITLALLFGAAFDANSGLYRHVLGPEVASSLLVILMMGTAILFPWTFRWQLAISSWACVGFFGAVLLSPHGLLSGASPVFSTITLAVGASVGLLGSSVLGRYRTTLARARHELRHLSMRLMRSQEEERQRVAHELHEGVGQSLSGLAAYLQSLERKIPDELGELRTRACESRRLATRTLAELRELSQLLRPSVLDDFGLAPSLGTYLRTFQDRHGIATELSIRNLPERLPADMETTIFRMVQEALTNVARHSHASRVRVACVASNGHVEVKIDDDGIGLPRHNGEGAGLIGIRERAKALGGTLTVASRPGVRLTVQLPLQRS